MEWITDSDLKQLLGSPKPPIAGVDLSRAISDIDSQVQPCSVDLRINEIFLPMEKVLDVNAVPRTFQHELKVGQSVKVDTTETFDLDNNYSAILFAPARLSRRGIVVPDVGHIDPGFSGKLRMTLINMGRDPYLMKKGDTVATILLFKLQKSCAYGLRQRQGLQPYTGGLEDIRHLAPDFLNISRTVKELAKAETERALGTSGWRYAFLVLFLPIVVALVLAFAGYYFQVGRELESFRVYTEAKISSLEKGEDLRKETLQLRTDEMRSQADTDRRLEALQRELDGIRAAAPAVGGGPAGKKAP